jgi:hypothetical protein
MGFAVQHAMGVKLGPWQGEYFGVRIVGIKHRPQQEHFSREPENLCGFGFKQCGI